ncbi:MAG: hypothetical protein QOC79_2855 [Actinomycetota bacterium]|nr:hypothetical protein [Actinomycetota bacterium]
MTCATDAGALPSWMKSTSWATSARSASTNAKSGIDGASAHRRIDFTRDRLTFNVAGEGSCPLLRRRFIVNQAQRSSTPVSSPNMALAVVSMTTRLLRDS